MDFFIKPQWVTDNQLLIYNIALILYFVYLMYKYSKCNIARYIIFLFTVGAFTDLGRLLSIGTSATHIYIVISLIWGIALIYKYGFNLNRRGIIICFLLYIFYFIFNSVVTHNDSIFLVVSQSIKYTISIVTFFAVDSFIKKTKAGSLSLLHNVINDIIVAQILFSIIKLLILRSTMEGWVGSLSGLFGGGAGTSFPLLCLLWLSFVTKMHFSRKFWYYIIGLLFIGFMTGKRAIWLLFPLEFIVLYVYYRVKNPLLLLKYIVPAFIMGCLFLYLGLRLSPTLNPDKKVWGRFDLEYAYEYAFRYSTGSNMHVKDEDVGLKEGDGRLGAALLFWNDFIDIFNYNQQVLFGIGNEKIKYYDKAEYSNRDVNLGVSSRGGITGIVFMYFISGVIGVILFLSYFLQIFFLPGRAKFKWIALGVVMFDFILYNGQTVNNVPMQSMLLVFLVIQSYSQRLKLHNNENINSSK